MRVLFSFGPSSHDANPYVDLLVDSVGRHVQVHRFSWNFALFGSYDVFHVHWPEALTRRRRWFKGLLVKSVFFLLLAKLFVLRIPVVRTEHNLTPHEEGGGAEKLALSLLDRLTTIRIVMNGSAIDRPGQQTTLILHGHYRDYYCVAAKHTKNPGSILNFGLIRPYKGIEDLVAAFKVVPPDLGLSLRIMGKPLSADVGDSVLREVAEVSSISTDLRHIPDDELCRRVVESELVVLPYQKMHNSGVLLLALSLGTPVLVPKNKITDDLAAEVGDRWVQRYEGKITADALISGAREVRNIQGRPDLSRREWATIGQQHVDVYRSVFAKRQPAGD